MLKSAVERAPANGALGEIAEAIAAGQDPSPAQYYLYYCERMLPLQDDLRAIETELLELADAEYAAAICLKSLEAGQ